MLSQPSQSASSVAGASAEQLIVQHVRQLTAVLRQLLPRMMAVSQERLATMPGITVASVPALATIPQTMQRALGTALETYRYGSRTQADVCIALRLHGTSCMVRHAWYDRQAVYDSIRSLADMQPEGPGEHLLRCMSDIADAYQELSSRDAPGQVLTVLQGIVVACGPHLQSVWSRYLDHYLDMVFGWVPAAAKELQAGGPRSTVAGVTKSTPSIRTLISELKHVAALTIDFTHLSAQSKPGRRPTSMRTPACNACSNATTPPCKRYATTVTTMHRVCYYAQGVHVGIPQLLSHETTREAFANTYTALAVKIDNIISTDAASVDVHARQWVLSLMTFAYGVRVHAHPELARRYNHLLYGEDEAQLARALSQDLQSDMHMVEGRMLAQYKDQCYAELDAALEDYFLRDGTLWDTAALPHGVRPSCMDLLQLLVGLEAELLLHAPMVVDTVLSDLVARLFQV